ncbi:DUF962-domain-containing protein [Macrolepiota fuliginosa MF-IS2]|uniref:DUF962-domain-containing protein n=1 Tax=Macrolepiota fuliginosa MF-IS2 TaxID=1400762 RepID=A0A9P5XKP1_9AGAR|nr:DUF962-domain-containing protein [Macrolepiota fuliginosa MF-IS2]
MSSSLFDVTKQLTFYGAYHSNRINILIHMICVPILLWTFQVLATQIPVPSAIPTIQHKFNDYLVFDLNWSAIHAGLYVLYYLALEPIAAVLYAPQLILSVLTATAFAQKSDGITQAALLHVGSWVAQFLGHGLAEKRAPALLDNLVGAVVLAPFFVHLELLFGLGYRPEFHRRVNNEIGKEITRIRKAQGDEKRRKEL